MGLSTLVLEETLDTICLTGKSAFDNRYNDLFHAGDHIGWMSPVCFFGTGSSPADWQYTQGNGTVSGSAWPLSSTFTWSSSTITLIVTPSIVSNKLRITVTMQATAGPDLATKFAGIRINLNRAQWAGFAYSTTGVVNSGTLPVTPGASKSVILSSIAATKFSIAGDGSHRKIDVEPNAASVDCYLVDEGTTGAAGDFRLYIGLDNHTILAASQTTFYVDISIPGGSAQDANSYSIDGTRTIPDNGAGGQYTELGSWTSAITASGILDLSSKAPLFNVPGARLKRNGRRLEYNGSVVKLSGGNIAFGATTGVTTGEIDARVPEFARRGIRIVRLHHIDDIGGLCDSNPSTAINATKLDKIHYWIYKLAQAGILFTLDLYSIRTIHASEANAIVPGASAITSFKTLCALNCPGAIANLQTFTSNLLLSRNPYTGNLVGQEPTLAYLDLNNEDISSSATAPGNADEISYINTRHTAEVGGTWDLSTERTRNWIASNMRQFNSTMRAYVRGLGCQALLTHLSNFNQDAYRGAFEDLRANAVDVETRHQYWNIPWTSSPFTAHNQTISDRAGAYGRSWWSEQPRSLEAERDTPLIVDEANCLAPWPGRNELGMVFGAIAGLESWDGVLVFDIAAGTSSLNSAPQTLAQYSIWTDPLRDSSWWIPVWALLVRGDMPARASQAAVDSGGWVGFTNVARNSQTRASRVITAGFKGYSGEAGTSHDCGGFKATILTGTRACVWACAMAYPSAPDIGSATSILVFHGTDLQMGGSVYNNARGNVLASIGSNGHRVYQGTCQIDLATANPAGTVVYRLNSAGTRGATVPVTVVNGRAQFVLDNNTTPTFFYEVVVTPPASPRRRGGHRRK